MSSKLGASSVSDEGSVERGRGCDAQVVWRGGGNGVIEASDSDLRVAKLELDACRVDQGLDVDRGALALAARKLDDGFVVVVRHFERTTPVINEVEGELEETDSLVGEFRVVGESQRGDAPPSGQTDWLGGLPSPGTLLFPSPSQHWLDWNGD